MKNDVLTTADIANTLIQAGEVKRCHTMRYNGEYTVGHHTYGVLSVLYAVLGRRWFQRKTKLILSALLHDTAELKVGDIPASIKKGKLGQALADLEHKVKCEAGIMPPTLSAYDERLLNAADKTELFCWACSQWRQGNRQPELQKMMDEVKAYIRDDCRDMPDGFKFMKILKTQSADLNLK